MSSLVSLKVDIQSFEDELVHAASEQIEAESLLNEASNKVRVLKDQVSRLKRALSIVEGTEVMRDEPVQSSVEPAPSAPLPEVPARPAPKPAYTGPKCGACGGKMFQTYKTVPSGITVSLLMCEDCNNENYQ